MKPLHGILVVSVEQAVAAPFCTGRLADGGARVIKIERPEGDFARGYDQCVNGRSSYFVWLNRGKESVVLDLATDADRAVLRRLAAKADVFVQNLKPGALARMGLRLDDLRRANPRLITCSISGYGSAGPMASRKAYDLLIQAESGLASITGVAGAPTRVGISIVDIATGATAQTAILEALIERASSGHGAHIEISMFDVMADWLSVPLLQAEAGAAPALVGLSHPSIAPYGVVKTAADSPLLIAVQNEREWKSFCDVVLERPELASDARFATNVARVRNRAELDGIVAKRMKRIERAAAIELLSKGDIAFAELNDMHRLSRHPLLRRVAVGGLGGASYPAPAPVFDGAPASLGSVPACGEHTESVKRELLSEWS